MRTACTLTRVLLAKARQGQSRRTLAICTLAFKPLASTHTYVMCFTRKFTIQTVLFSLLIV